MYYEIVNKYLNIDVVIDQLHRLISSYESIKYHTEDEKYFYESICEVIISTKLLPTFSDLIKAK